jgi:hypothetical protein
VSSIKGSDNILAAYAGLVDEVPMLTIEDFLSAVSEVSVAKLRDAFAAKVKGKKGMTMKDAKAQMHEAIVDLGVITTSEVSHYLMRDRSQPLGCSSSPERGHPAKTKRTTR